MSHGHSPPAAKREVRLPLPTWLPRIYVPVLYAIAVFVFFFRVLATNAYAFRWDIITYHYPAQFYLSEWILSSDHAFRAVLTPAGAHTVEMRFEPLSVSVGFLVSTLTFLVLLLAWIAAPKIEQRVARAQ